MYKEILVITLLAAAACGFPPSGAEDLARAAPEYNSPVQFGTNSGNPDELIKDSAQLTTNLRKTRDCNDSVSSNCRTTGINPQDMFRHIETLQVNQYKGELDTRRDYMNFFGNFMKRP